MKKLILLLLLPISIFAQKHTVSGNITDASNGEAMISAYVYVKGSDEGTISNFYGFYSLTLDAGKYTLIFDYTGYESMEKEVDLTNEDIKLNIELSPSAEQIDVVEVTAEKKDDNIKKIDMSTVELDIKEIEKVPALLGEADVVRSLQLLPGVSTVGEGATGFNVRGGGIDQNLVLLDEAPVFNSSHLFGFFSVFNPDAVKNVKLIKGGIPSQYGGRLSSILDIRMKEGNRKEFAGEGGLGLIFSRLSLEAPIVKDKSSFLIAGRRSYIDVLAKPFLTDDLSESQFYFYDLTAKLNYDFSDRDKLYASGYFGRDVFGAGFFFNWGNATSTLRWNHIYNDKLFSNVTAYYSNYDFNIGVGDEETGGFSWKGNIINYSIKPEWIWYLNEKNTISFGVQSILYQFKPGNSEFYSEGETIDFSQDNRFGLENAAYIGNEQKVGKGIIMQYGLRFSQYSLMGRGKEYIYGDRATINDSRELLEIKEYGDLQAITNNMNLEPRFSIKFPVDSASSIKASYNRMAQYIHLMSNTAAATPLDLYSPTTNNIKPQLADQIAAGYFRNFGKNFGYETSAEIYYKQLYNQIGYIPTAELVLNDLYEGDLLFGDGRAYGLELFVKKKKGKFTGWISYTLSRTELQIDGINNSDFFNQRFDRPHVGNIVLNYAFTKRIELGLNFVYNTGVPVTFSTNRFALQNVEVVQNPSNSLNNSRVPDYHRVDLSFTIYGKEKNKKDEKKIWSGDWVFSVYNAYNRQNAFTVYLDPERGEAIQYSIVASVIPSVTYNFKF